MDDTAGGMAVMTAWHLYDFVSIPGISEHGAWVGKLHLVWAYNRIATERGLTCVCVQMNILIILIVFVYSTVLHLNCFCEGQFGYQTRRVFCLLCKQVFCCMVDVICCECRNEKVAVVITLLRVSILNLLPLTFAWSPDC